MMLRISIVNLKMYFFLIFFSIFYTSVNSLSEDKLNNTSTTIKPPNSTTIFTLVKPSLAQNGTFLNQTRTMISTPEKRNETESMRKVFSFFTKTAVLGRGCKITEDCNKKMNSICVNGTCHCKPDFVTTNNRSCLLKAKKLDDPCTEDIQCDSIYGVSGVAVCVSFHCVCSANTKLVNNKCFKKAVLGRSCNVDEECNSIPYSYCYQKVCSCDPDFTPDENGTNCYLSNGPNNVTNVDCTNSSLVCKKFGEDAYCSKGICICYPGYHLNLSSGVCVSEKRLGEDCDNNSDCIIDTNLKETRNVRECKNKKCSCIKEYKSLTEHNLCQSGSSVIKGSVLLIMIVQYFLFN